MPGYQVKQQTVHVGALDYRIESLLDRTQYSDPDGAAEARGIPECAWSFFGQLWPAGLVLAEAMADIAPDGRRVLEIGCGLALAGIVAHRRALDVTVSDIHPLGERFLRRNLALNQLGPLPFRDLSWCEANPTLGRFDLVIGSDVLYEREHPEQLAGFLDAHTHAGADVMIVDPGRHRSNEFSRRMALRGFDCESTAAGPGAAGRTRVLRYRQR
jgi:predicted nicotinamide N-methyase